MNQISRALGIPRDSIRSDYALGEAHRRLTAQLAPGSVYHRANYNGLADLVYRLTRSTLVRGAHAAARGTGSGWL